MPQAVALVSYWDAIMETTGHPVVSMTLPVLPSLCDGGSDWSSAKT